MKVTLDILGGWPVLKGEDVEQLLCVFLLTDRHSNVALYIY